MSKYAFDVFYCVLVSLHAWIAVPRRPNRLLLPSSLGAPSSAPTYLLGLAAAVHYAGGELARENFGKKQLLRSSCQNVTFRFLIRSSMGGSKRPEEGEAAERRKESSSSTVSTSLAATQSAVSAAYARRLLENFDALRHQSGGGADNLCDVEIVPGHGSSKVFLAHRTVLSAASPYFNAMFTGRLAEAKRHQVVLRSVSEDALDSLLDFIYTGSVAVDRHNVQELMVAADMMELREVVQLCTAYLEGELEPTNVVGIYRFASDHNCSALRVSAESFIHQNFDEVSKGEEFRDLPREMLIEFLRSELLRVDAEYQVFRGAMNWICADVTTRRCFIFDVLKFVRLPLVPCKLLDACAAECADASIRVALNSVKQDLLSRKGSLVPLNAHPRRAAKKNVYVIGGSQRELRSAWTKSERTYNTVEVFDTFERRWREASPMRVGRILPGIAVLNGLIYVCGGEVDSQILANGEVYDPNEDEWRVMASMTIPRCEFGMCALGTHLYAFGGWVGEDIGGSIERYDAATDQWTLIDKMPEPRFSMGIVAHQSLIYLVGGCTHSRRHMQELVSFNPVTVEWNTHASMLEPRSQMGCVVLDDHLYVLGGTNRHNEVLQSVERYSFVRNTWERVPSMLQPRASPSLAAADGKIFVFGGDQINEVNFYRARTTISSAECFDPLANAWTESEALPQSRSEAGAVVI